MQTGGYESRRVKQKSLNCILFVFLGRVLGWHQTCWRWPWTSHPLPLPPECWDYGCVPSFLASWSSRDQIQGSLYVSQALYQLNYTPSPSQCYIWHKKSSEGIERVEDKSYFGQGRFLNYKFCSGCGRKALKTNSFSNAGRGRRVQWDTGESQV